MDSSVDPSAAGEESAPRSPGPADGDPWRGGQPSEHPVSPRLRWLSEVVWRSGLLIAAFLIVAWALWKLKLVVLPVFIALLLCTVLSTPVVALERRGWRSGLATAVVFTAFLAVIVGALVLIIPRTVDGLAGLDAATADAVQDLEDWLVTGPLDLNREDVQQYTTDPIGQIIDVVQSSSVSLTTGLRTVGKTLVGLVLSLVFTVMFLADGRRFQHWVIERVKGRREAVVRNAAARAWAAFGGFLRGAAILGVVEGVMIGSTMWIVGAPLALTIGVITFAAAFFPIVGAIVAGVLAVLVTFASSGLVPALLVGVVAVLVQQLDSDLLSPLVYGRQLEIHPVFILMVLTVGGAMGGIAGAFVAVPLTAALVGVADVLWHARSIVDDMGPDQRLGAGRSGTAGGSEPDGGGG